MADLTETELPRLKAKVKALSEEAQRLNTDISQASHITGNSNKAFAKNPFSVCAQFNIVYNIYKQTFTMKCMCRSNLFMFNLFSSESTKLVC